MAVVPRERLRAGQAFEGEGDRAGVADLACRGEPFEVERAGPAGVAALFGDESELGQEQRHAVERHAVVRFQPAVPVERVAQVRFGGLQLALPSGAEPGADLGELLGELVGLLGGQSHGPLVELPGLGEVAGQQGDPAEAGEAVGDVGPQLEFLGDAQAVPVQAGGPPVVAGDLGQVAERVRGLQPAPAVAQLTEERGALRTAPSGRGEVAAEHRLSGLAAQRRGHAPAVVEGAEAGQGPAGQVPAGGHVAEVEMGEPQKPLRPRVVRGLVDAVIGFQSRTALPHEVRAVAGQHREPGLPGGGPGQRGGGRRSVHGQRRRQQAVAFPVASAQEPVPGGRVDQAQCEVGFAAPRRALERAAHVRGFGVEALQPQALAGAVQVRLGPLGQLGVVDVVPTPYAVGLSRRVQPFETVGRDRFEQPVPGAVRAVHGGDQRAVHQADQQIEHVGGVQILTGTDRLGRFQGAPVGVDGQPAQHDALGLGEQLPAPVDHRPQGLLPGRGTPLAGGQQAETVVQPLGQPARAQRPDPGGRQLQREGEAVEPSADRRDRGGVVRVEDEARRGRRRARHEQAHGARPAQVGEFRAGGGAGELQRRDRLEHLSRDGQGLLAGRQDAQPRCLPQ
ncbi:hypothetical protein [Streptosporangium roseum]|uniref:hypothetical protein n=1 Tax=Streptosporangium roseum TaxID=2001 RepID=UPI003D9DB6E5